MGGKRGFRGFLGWISWGGRVTGFAPRRNCWEMRFLWDNLEFWRCLKEYFVSPGSPCGASSHPTPKLPQILKLQWIIPLGIPPISQLESPIPSRAWSSNSKGKKGNLTYLGSKASPGIFHVNSQAFSSWPCPDSWEQPGTLRDRGDGNLDSLRNFWLLEEFLVFLFLLPCAQGRKSQPGASKGNIPGFWGFFLHPDFWSG